MMPEAGITMLRFLTAEMTPLAEAFFAARARRDREAAAPAPLAIAGSDPEPMEAALRALLAAGAAAHPELSLGSAAFAVHFASHLGRCGAPVGAAGSASLHAGDLYLAAAALSGDGAALAKLRQIHRPVIAGYLRTIDTSTPFVDEVEQRLWDTVLVAAPGNEPKLAGYSGQGALAGWLGISAQRIALMIRRHEGVEERATGAAAADADGLAADPELAFIKGALRDKFRDALTAALAGLEDRERMIYKMHVVDGLTVAAIGKVYGVNASTVSRWLAKARDGVIREAKRLLHDEMRLSPAEFESVAGLMVSQLDLSVSRLLNRAR
jgi:RNA polymerase sigma-70 factor (ECF subfamily)